MQCPHNFLNSYKVISFRSVCERINMATPFIDVLSLLLLVLMAISLGPKPSESARVFTIINNCKETIWPAIFPGEYFDGGGFPLKQGQSAVFTAPIAWSGRIWGRTGCSFDSRGAGTCQTGACGDTLKCTGSGKTPATLAEFTLASPDFYDVSLVDGFNLPMAVIAINGSGNCSAAGCNGDLRPSCPAELALRAGKRTVGCRSACDVFDTDEYCCRGVHGNSMTCQPTYYSKLFKSACPKAYSYAYDDPSSIFTCTGTDYVVAFCTQRNQTACTYHNRKVVCSGSRGLNSLIAKWWAIALPLLWTIYLWIVS